MDSIIAEHVASVHLSYSYCQLCSRNLVNLVPLVKSLELFVIQKLTNQTAYLHPLCQGSLPRQGLKQRLRDYPGYKVEEVTGP